MIRLILIVCMVPMIFASQPGLGKRYPVPPALQLQRSMVEFPERVEGYFSVEALTTVTGARLEIESSQPDSMKLALYDQQDRPVPLIQEGSIMYFPVGQLSLGDPRKFRVVASDIGEFSMAAVSFRIRYNYPRDWAVAQIHSTSDSTYANAPAREVLIRKLMTLDTYEQVSNMIFSRRKAIGDQ